MAYGIKLSVEARFNGDVTLDAKIFRVWTALRAGTAKQELRAQLTGAFLTARFPPELCGRSGVQHQKQKDSNPRHVVLEWLWKSARLSFLTVPDTSQLAIVRPLHF